MSTSESSPSRQAAETAEESAEDVATSGPGDGGGDPESAHPDVARLDYEQARDELADVVQRLEAGGLTLEESLALWERGEALAAACERHLAGARERVDRALASVESSDEAEQ